MGRGELDYHRTRFDFVELAMPVARHSLVIPVRVKLPIFYQGSSSTPPCPSDPNEPSNSDKEKEESYSSSDARDYGDEVGSRLVDLMNVARERIVGREGVLGRVDRCRIWKPVTI
jgi:hypothetical protein